MEVIGFSFTVVKTKPSSGFASCAIALRLNKPKAAIRILFFILMKLILNCFGYKYTDSSLEIRLFVLKLHKKRMNITVS